MSALRLVLSVLLAAAPLLSRCCINEYGHTLQGNEVELIGPPYPSHTVGDSASRRRAEELRSRYEHTHSVEDYSDYGAWLVYSGQYESARNVFLEIERSTPGRYITAANLGTAYELLGQNDAAYLWTKKAVALDPASHNGSEWIHLRILDLKRKGLATRAYLQRHDVLGLDFGDKEVPGSSLTADSLHTIHRHLFDQLQERLSFVQPPEPVVARLFFDLANITLLTKDVETAAQEFYMARTYGCQGDVFNRRIAYAHQLSNSYQRERAFRETHRSYPHIVSRAYGWIDRNKLWLVVAALALALLAAGIMIRKKKKNKIVQL